MYDHTVKIKYQVPLEALGTRETRKRGDASGSIQIDEEEYADDLVIISGTVEEAQNTLSIFNATFSKFGLTIAKENTETLAFGFDKSTMNQKSLMTVDVTAIKMLASSNI